MGLESTDAIKSNAPQAPLVKNSFLHYLDMTDHTLGHWKSMSIPRPSPLREGWDSTTELNSPQNCQENPEKCVTAKTKEK